jgi:flagellar biosynthesis chaperone FliJ
MTHHVAHTNKMVFDLKTQYQNRISQLQNKIDEQKIEISLLQEQIDLLTKEKYYDC